MNRLLNKIVDELWFNFYSSEERMMCEEVVGLKWDLIGSPHTKIAFVYSAAGAMRQMLKESRENQRDKYVMDRLEGIAVKEITHKKELFDKYLNQCLVLEREKQAQIGHLAREWMGRQEGMHEKELGVRRYIADRQLDRMDSLARYRLDREEALEREFEFRRESQRDRQFGAVWERDRQYQQKLLDMKKESSDSKTPVSYHPTIGSCALGDIGPTGVMSIIIREDGEYKKCNIAEAADGRSVLGIQLINRFLRKQGTCPLPESRNLAPRLLPFVPKLRNKTCQYASGEWIYSRPPPRIRG